MDNPNEDELHLLLRLNIEKEERAERISAAIANLEPQKSQIETNGEVAPQSNLVAAIHQPILMSYTQIHESPDFW